MEKQNEHFTVIGEFLTYVNNFEFVINLCIEKIIRSISSHNLPFINDIEYYIDSIHRQSLRDRISFIITMLSANNSHSDAEELLSFFNSFYKFYNKEVRNYRDFVAHNPYVQSQNAIISARRYGISKNEIERLEIKEISDLCEKTRPKVLELFNASEKISNIYNAIVVKDLRNSNGQ